MNETCQTCQRWTQSVKNVRRKTFHTHGECSLPDDSSNNYVWLSSEGGYDPMTLLTEGDFGCNQWVQRETTT